jgi:mannose-6-phosphate isomerase-like protein (cupin superfamily)
MSAELQMTPAPLWFIDNLAYVHVDGEESRGAYSLCEIWGAHGNMPPLHVHHRDDETFYVRDGELRLFVGDHEIVLHAGQAALAPRGVPHTYRVESEQASWIVINSPAGFEQFLRAASEPAPNTELPPPGRPGDPAALTHAAAAHGIDIVGPPGMLPTHT